MSRSSSGHFLLRTDPALHTALKRAAARAGISLNELCQESLRKALGAAEGIPPIVEAVRAEFADSGLVGVVLFGSAARGEPTATSDLDLLIVLEPDATIERSLYRRWDESGRIRAAIGQERHPVSPQFVGLPRDPLRAGGLWLETAVEGRMLWDPEARIHRVLVELRKAMLEGKLARAFSHGHPYWIRREAG